MPVDMPLALKESRTQLTSSGRGEGDNKHSFNNQGEDYNAQPSDKSGSHASGALELERTIGVHAVDQETLERDIALEVLKLECAGDLGVHVQRLMMRRLLEL